MGEAGYESRSANCAFAGRRLSGRVRMTIAAGAVAYRERTFALGGGGLVAPARVLDRERAALVVVDVQEAFRPAVLDFDAVAAGVAALVRGRADPRACRWWPPSSTRRGSGATVPEVAEHLDGVEPLEKVCFSAADGGRLRPRRARPGARVRDRVARVRVADRPRPARPRRRGARGARRGHLAHRGEPRAGAAQDGGRRARSSRASRPRCSSCSAPPGRTSSSRSRGWSSEPAYLLLEDGTRFDGDWAGRRRSTASARWSSTPRCPATRRRSPTPATPARSSSSPTR